MALEISAVLMALLGIAGIFGTLLGVWITAWYNSKDLRLQLASTRSIAVLQLQHDHLLEILAMAEEAALKLLAHNTPQWTREDGLEFFGTIKRLNRKMPYLAGVPAAFVSFTNLQSACMTLQRRIETGGGPVSMDWPESQAVSKELYIFTHVVPAMIQGKDVQNTADGAARNFETGEV